MEVGEQPIFSAMKKKLLFSAFFVLGAAFAGCSDDEKPLDPVALAAPVLAEDAVTQVSVAVVWDAVETVSYTHRPRALAADGVYALYGQGTGGVGFFAPQLPRSIGRSRGCGARCRRPVLPAVV